MHGIDEMLSSLGFIVLGMTGIAPYSRPSSQPPSEGTHWKQAKRLMRAARFAVSHPRVNLVCLHSFGCGYDAISLEAVRAFLEEAGRPFTALKVDEMVETAHIRIRLRTLAESLSTPKATWVAPEEPLCSPEGALSNGLPELLPVTRAVTEEDVCRARTSPLKDACFTANVLGAQARRALDEDPTAQAITLPEACKRCMNEAAPLMVERARGQSIAVDWDAEPKTATKGTGALSLAEPKDRPRIGLLGNPLLVFEPLMNDGIISLIESLGCEVVLPEEEALYTEDVSYLDQLERFYGLGVDQVIYLQSFGCVKGHVRARGQHHRFTERFPKMPVTVIDYDPESSALNRENRIRLIAEAAKRAWRSSES